MIAGKRKAGYNQRWIRLPNSLDRAVNALAISEGRSFNAQVLKILADTVDWKFYEESEEREIWQTAHLLKHQDLSAGGE